MGTGDGLPSGRSLELRCVLASLFGEHLIFKSKVKMLATLTR
jgi:hypothetical protein